MYIAKVYLNRQLMDVNLYEDYEHFLSDLIDGSSDLYDHLPTETVSETRFECPKIDSGGQDDLGFSGDYEYRYDTGILVYCGTILTAEDLARGCNKED